MAEFRRVLSTGGAGFLGSSFVRFALRRHPEWDIVVFDRVIYAGSLHNLADEPVTGRKGKAG